MTSASTRHGAVTPGGLNETASRKEGEAPTLPGSHQKLAHRQMRRTLTGIAAALFMAFCSSAAPASLETGRTACNTPIRKGLWLGEPTPRRGGEGGFLSGV